MISKDYLLKAIDTKKQLRVFLCHTSSVVEEAHRRHNTSATASAALGRTLTAALILGSDLKNERDMLTLRINGGGIVGPIIASVDSRGNCRGLVSNPAADLPSRYPGKLAVGELVGKDGYLEVIKDLGMRQPYIGRVPLVSGEIGEDMVRYFLQSEQIPSLFSLGVLVAPDLSIKAAGGLLIQALPGADDRLLELVENNVLNAGSISSLMDSSESLEDILSVIMEGVDYSITGEQPLAFRCTCSAQRLAGIMASLPEDEIKEILENVGKLEVTCNFCNQVYQYTLEEIQAMKS